MVASPSQFAIDTLRRHSERRRQGIPTVSFFVDAAESAPGLWQESIGNSAAGVAIVHDPHLSPLVSDWLACVDQQGDISAALTRFLNSSLPPAHRSLMDLLHHKAPHEIAMALEQILPDEPPPHVTWLVRQLVCQRAVSPGERPLLSRMCKAQTGASVHLLIAAHALLSPEHSPGLLLTRGSATDGDAWLAAGAESLTQLATAVPTLPLAIAVDGPTIDRFLSSCNLTRTGAMIREGLIFLDRRSSQQDFTAAQRATAPTTGNPDTVFGPTLRTPAPLAEESDAAPSAPVPLPRTREEDDRARSAAERFLFERLQDLSETTGLFALNEIIAADGVHGQKAEIDLCSPSLRIAIEIDGYYHFGEPEAYRRDRRKDWALQQTGYVILRFLADDVVDQLETVLGRIAATVRRRRPQLPPQGESCR